MPDCTAASPKCREGLAVSIPSAKGRSLCAGMDLECAEKEAKKYWDKMVFKEGCELVFDQTGKSS